MERKIRTNPIGSKQSVIFGFNNNGDLIIADSLGISKY